MNRALRKEASQSVDLRIGATACPAAPPSPIPAGGRAPPSTGTISGAARRPIAAGLRPLYGGRMRTRCKLTALTPKEPSRRYQRERPDAPCISTSKRCSPTFKRRRSSHHRQPWETGKDVGYRVLHVAIDDCAPLACVQMPPDEQRCATACLFLPRWPRIWARSACIPQVATDHEPEIAPDCSAMRRMLGSNISALGPTREDQRRSRALHPLPAAKWPFIPVQILPSKGREPAK